ncbi:MAG: SapC family protein [Alphaproteobacteria bacterium]
MTTETQGTEAQQQAMPLFYKKIERLSSNRHGTLGLKPAEGPFFAETTNSVPITVAEFAACIPFYPIVFVGADKLMPVAILGLRNEQNLMLEGGKWARGAYIPAYIRRYPFIFVKGAEDNQLTLGVDMDSGLVAENTDAPLFDADGKQTENVEKVLKFCGEYQKQIALTEAFSQELKDSGILVEKTSTLTVGSGERLALGPYMIVDPEKFEALPEEKVLDWRKRGLLPVVFWQMASQNAWNVLASRMPENETAKAA